MREASKKEIDDFKKQFCKSDEKRISMIENFTVSVASFEELLPNKRISSYATGNKDIEGSFMIFKVTDQINQIEYYPVFSETVSRKMLNSWKVEVPRKMSVFSEINNNPRPQSNGVGMCNDHANSEKLRILISLVRSLMIHRISSPKPLTGPLKEICEKLEKNVAVDVNKSDVKSVNTILKVTLKNKLNTDHENFSHLDDYIEYLRIKYPSKKLRNTDFTSLREILHISYPNEEVFF